MTGSLQENQYTFLSYLV